MYWKVGEFLSKETEHASYGDAYIDEISREIQETFPGIKGFNRRGLYRMKKFYETYKDNDIVTPLVTCRDARQMRKESSISVYASRKIILKGSWRDS